MSAKCAGVFEKKCCIKINTKFKPLKTVNQSLAKNERIFGKSLRNVSFNAKIGTIIDLINFRYE